VIVFSRLSANGIAKGVEALMKKIFDGSEASHVLRQLCNMFPSSLDDILGGTRNIRGQCQLDVVDGWGLPGLNFQSWSLEGLQRVDTGETYPGSVFWGGSAGFVITHFDDQAPHLAGHGMTRRFGQECLQCLNTLLAESQVNQCLTKDKSRRAGFDFAPS